MTRGETIDATGSADTTHRITDENFTRTQNHHLQLLEKFPVLIWRSGPDSLCNHFNHTWLEFTGRTLEQELGEGWLEGVHPDDLHSCMTTYLSAFNERRPFAMEYRLRHHDGSYRWITDHGSPCNDPEGNFDGYIGGCLDINSQKQAELELRKAREQLERELSQARTLESIGQLAAGVAHEVRNPLNAILSISEALFKESEIGSNPEFSPYLQHIRTQVKRLAHLMNELLDLGKPIPASSLQPTPLYELCRETAVLWKSSGSAPNKRVVLSSDQTAAESYVMADSMKLQQVFFNLLENAGHHSPHDSKILFQLNSTDAGAVVIQIIDAGSGIPEDKRGRIFDPFYSNRKGGTGLGLALVKHFIEHMGGAVRIWNNDAAPGCIAEIRLPLAREIAP